MVLPSLQTARGSIRLPGPAEAPKLLQYRLDKHEHLAPWKPLRSVEYCTLEQCSRAGMSEAAKKNGGHWPPFLGVTQVDSVQALAAGR